MLRAIRNLLNARKGFRWSLYFVHLGELRYALHENSAIRLLGYVLPQAEKGKWATPEWQLFLNFNFKNSSFELLQDHFSDGKLSSDLLETVARIDPGWQVKGGKPVFVDARSNRTLPLGGGYDAAFQRTDDRLAAITQMLNSPPSETESFASVLRVAFH